MVNNTNNPLVSVIIAVYNIEKFIGACLESILKQNYDNWEAIVVNDGSTDTSLEVCESFAKTDARFKVITTENGGSSNARNHGLDFVKGEYVMFVDGDDIIVPDAIVRSVEKIQSLGVDILCTSCVSVTEDGKKVLRKSNQQLSNRLDAMQTLRMIHSGCGIIPGIWAKIYRAELLKDIRFNLKLRMAQDIFFNTELLIMKPETTIAITNIITYQYRIRSSSMTHTNPTTKVRPYIEAMSLLIPQYSGIRDVDTISQMANSVFGMLVSDVIRKPILYRYPDEWGLNIISQLTPYITNQQYLKLIKISSNRKKTIIGFTTRKYSRLISKLIRRMKRGFRFLFSIK